MTSDVSLILDTIISSLFDPNPIAFTRMHEKGVRPVKNVVSNNPPGRIVQLRNVIPRNSFLLGCLDFTQNSEIEYLLIGYGKKVGQGTQVNYVEYAKGEKSSVNISDESRNRIAKHLRQRAKNEVVIFHNHTSNWINNLLDNVPLASVTDRNTLLRDKYLEPIVLLKTILSVGSVRFYIGENGFVREYKSPSILSLLHTLTAKYHGI